MPIPQLIAASLLPFSYCRLPISHFPFLLRVLAALCGQVYNLSLAMHLPLGPLPGL